MADLMRVVVVLRRGEDVWQIDVPDVASVDEAETHALDHANGYFDTTMRVQVPPSNGPAGWRVERHLDAFEYEGGKQIR